jgi:hypothetical protein
MTINGPTYQATMFEYENALVFENDEFAIVYHYVDEPIPVTPSGLEKTHQYTFVKRDVSFEHDDAD